MLPCSLYKNGTTKSQENPRGSYPNHRDVEIDPNNAKVPDIGDQIPIMSRGRGFLYIKQIL